MDLERELFHKTLTEYRRRTKVNPYENAYGAILAARAMPAAFP